MLRWIEAAWGYNSNIHVWQWKQIELRKKFGIKAVSRLYTVSVSDLLPVWTFCQHFGKERMVLRAGAKRGRFTYLHTDEKKDAALEPRSVLRGLWQDHKPQSDEALAIVL